MNLLVTGGGGYVGTVLIRHLLESTDHQLTAFGRFVWGLQPLVSILRPQYVGRLTILRGDVRDAQAVADVARDADLCIHLAAIVGFPACAREPDEAVSTNVTGTALVCTAMQGRPVLFASTGSVYGKVEGVCTEETPPNPLTVYGSTKLTAERIVMDYGGMAFRIASLFGLSPRMRWDILPHDFAKSGVAGKIRLFDGEARRTLLHVEDVARAFGWAADHVHAGQVFNLGCEDYNLTKREIAETIQRLTGCDLVAGTGHDPDERDYHVSYQKIRAAGWQAQWAWSDGAVAQVVDAAWAWEELR